MCSTEDAEGRVPEVVEEHVDAERRRPVGHGHADAVGRHRAAHEEQRPGEDRGEQRPSSAARPVGGRARAGVRARSGSDRVASGQVGSSRRDCDREGTAIGSDRGRIGSGHDRVERTGLGGQRLGLRQVVLLDARARCTRRAGGRPSGSSRSCSAAAARSSPTPACSRARGCRRPSGPTTRL